MANLTDLIERYLKQLLAKSETGTVDVGRNQLAEAFACAPSQINYVLATRFLVENGYIVETRRGGGGYVRLTVLELDPAEDWHFLIESIDETMSYHKCEAVINRLVRDGFISEREAMLMSAALSRDTLNMKQPWNDMARANILQAMLVALYRADLQ